MKMSFWKDGFSIDESKQSMLVFLTFVCTVFALVMYGMNGSIGDNLFKIVQTGLLSIAGVTGIKSLEVAAKSVLGSSRVQDAVRSDEDMYEDEY